MAITSASAGGANTTDTHHGRSKAWRNHLVHVLRPAAPAGRITEIPSASRLPRVRNEVASQAREKAMTLIEKIQCHVTLDGDCWEWHGCMNGSIPIMKHDGKVANVRRLVLIERGTPMNGYIATFTCGNPKCVNPEHTARSTRVQMNRRIMADMSSATNTLRSKRIAEAKREKHAKLSQADVEQIRASGDTHQDLAARFGISKSIIGRIKRGEMWRKFSASPFAGLFA